MARPYRRANSLHSIFCGIIAFGLVGITLGYVLIFSTVPSSSRSPKTAGAVRISVVKSDLRRFQEALQLYQRDTGQFPTTEQGLVALLREPAGPPPSREWAGPYLERPDVPLDPWGEEYLYTAPGQKGEPFVIISPGLQNMAALSKGQTPTVGH
jgi:general secretion pathway protein G